jgi:hypothetical protein
MRSAQELTSHYKALKDNIRLEIATAENGILRRTADNMHHRIQMCPVDGDNHFKCLMQSHPVLHEFMYVSSVSFHSVHALRNYRPQRLAFYLNQ